MFSLAFVFFRNLDLNHLDRSLYSIKWQTLQPDEFIFVDNNTDYSKEDITNIVANYFGPNQIKLYLLKHQDLTKQHSYSANFAIRHCSYNTFIFARSDFVLHYQYFEEVIPLVQTDKFISSWGYMIGEHEDPFRKVKWKENLTILTENSAFFPLTKTDWDAPIFATTKETMEHAGWYNEQLSSWGHQQTHLQVAMKEAGVTFEVVPKYLFFHQSHYADRNMAKADQEEVLLGLDKLNPWKKD